MTVSSWFTGIGAADLAFELAGYRVVRQCEIDTHCIELLEERWPNVTRNTDITKATGSYADVYVGGWPCQDLSVAGKRQGLSGSRSGLFYELVRVVDEGRPRYLVWENVPGLLSSGGGRDFRIVLRELAGIGYFGAWRVLDSQFFGVAQRRRRVFGVFACGSDSWRRAGAILLEPEGRGRNPSQGRKAGEDIARALDTFPGGDSAKQQQRTSIARCLTAKAASRYDGDTETFVASCLQADDGRRFPRGDGSDNLIPFPVYYSHDNNQDRIYSLHRTAPTHTATQSNVARKILCPPPDPDGVRAPTGVPDWLDRALPVGYDSRRYKQLGNAMTVNVLYWIAKRIANCEETFGH